MWYAKKRRRDNADDKHRRGPGMMFVGVAVGAACALVIPQSAASASPAGPKGAPPLPTISEFSSVLSRPVTDAPSMDPAKKSAWTNAQKQAQASGRTTMALATSNRLAEHLYQQINESYCGPATLAMVTNYLGVGYAGTGSDQQSPAASLLGTNGDGTAWYGSDNVPSYPKSSWYPMQDAVNWRLYHAGKSMWYDVVALPGSPTSAQQIAFRDHLTFDIDHNYPGEDNQYSVNGYQIGYQPPGTWYHWWSARGYQNNGEVTEFNDPAQWSAGRMSHATTRGGPHTVVVALGGRGYIW
jgi:hypothetical protein